jgi:succinate-semialdehyde dehydrogenase / glutarate-semialdehyde dehydrogenase
VPIASVNPFTGATLKTFDPISDHEIERRLALSWTRFHDYRKCSFAVRAANLLRAAEILESESRRFGELMTAEMGKTISAGEAEAKKCAWVCRYYAETGERSLAGETIATNASKSYTLYEPLGPVLAIMPWNFPFWQVFRFAAPALMAGNTGLLKHAGNVPQCALAIEEIFLRAGFPEGVFQTLLIESDRVAPVIADDRVAAVTLTGSESAGRSVAGHAGNHLKKTVLELGGSDPFIIMPSADLNAAVDAAVRARIINNGQSCIAAKRFLIADETYDSCERTFVEKLRALRIGDPMDASTDIGPLATPQILADLDRQVKRAVAAGARILTGGQIARGNLYQPTALADVPRSSEVYREEFFGPVAMLFRVGNVQEAIDLANDSPFGLGASVWTSDPGEQQRFIEGIESGQVFVNAIVASDPRLPFGGVKKSGYGRELGVAGIHEFVNLKTVWIG